LEVSVTTFPKPEGQDPQEAILMNVNRWRGQMGLPPITMDHLDDQTKKISLAGETCVFVNLTGKLGKGGMGAPPFAGGAVPPGHPELPPDHPQLPLDHPAIPAGGAANSEKLPAGNPPAAAPADLTFDTPAGWQPGSLNSMRKAAFVVEDGPRKVEITVIGLPPSDLLSNVNRWRGQLQLSETTAEDLNKQIKPLSIDGIKGSYIELVGPSDPAPQQTIIVAMAPAADQVWFIKLSGDAKLAEREKPKFDAFLKSIKFAAK
jgi:hypothetical protein